MLDEIVDGVTECICAKIPDICYEPKEQEAPLIHEEGPIGQS